MDLVLHLRGLLAVADELSVSRAAERLGLDQPLLSRRIRALERHLEVDLLDRSRRQIALTPAAVALLPRVRQLVAQADSLVRSARGSDDATFALAVPRYVQPPALASVVDHLRKHQVPAVARELDDDRAAPSAWEVRPCDPSDATWRTPLGVATTAPLPGAVARLVELRPRRGAEEPVLLVTAADTGAPWWRHVLTALDRSGFSPRHVQEQTAALAVAQVLGGGARLLVPRDEAVQLGLSWTPVAHAALVRGHRLVEHGVTPSSLRPPPVRQRAVELLGHAVGAV